MKCIRCHSYAINLDPVRELCDVCYYKRPLLDLLAIIHRDGGQAVLELGLENAIEEAKRIVGNNLIK